MLGGDADAWRMGVDDDQYLAALGVHADEEVVGGLCVGDEAPCTGDPVVAQRQDTVSAGVVQPPGSDGPSGGELGEQTCLQLIGAAASQHPRDQPAGAEWTRLQCETELFIEDGQLGEALTNSIQRLRDGDREPSQVGDLRPQRGIVPGVGGRRRADLLGVPVAGQHLLGGGAQFVLLGGR